MEAPPIDPAIVEWLEAIYPDTLPREGTDLEELHKLQGQRRVVNRVRAELNKQLEKS